MQRARKKTPAAVAVVVVLTALASLVFLSSPKERSITVASATSTESSGLFGYLLPMFTNETGIEVRVVAVGTGQAIRLAMRGDADVLLVHHRASEEKFVSEGYGVERVPLMHNDFVIVGPASDPAGIDGLTDPVAAFDEIRKHRVTFVSRGDDSGTHKRELSFWQGLSGEPGDDDADWYRESGAGQGATLNIAGELDGYCLSDRATWVKFGNKRNLEILVEGDPGLLNPYSLILVSKEKHRHVNAAAGRELIDWLTSQHGQELIAAYRVGGQQLFFPDAQEVAAE